MLELELAALNLTPPFDFFFKYKEKLLETLNLGSETQKSPQARGGT